MEPYFKALLRKVLLHFFFKWKTSTFILKIYYFNQYVSVMYFVMLLFFFLSTTSLAWQQANIKLYCVLQMNSSICIAAYEEHYKWA